MAKDTDSLTVLILREIRAKQDEHTSRFDSLEGRMDVIEKQVSRMSKLLTYSIGQSDETQFLQSQQEGRIDELFEKLEELLSRPQPV